MTQSEIENEPPGGKVVLRHTPGRTVAFVAFVLVWAVYIGFHLVFHQSRILWLDALGGLAGAALAYTGLAVAAQAVRGVPVLQMSEAGIAINHPWGRMFVRWTDTADFSAGNFRWVRIRLREGARPVGSTWTLIASASLWTRRTIAVPAFTTVAHPTEIAEALTLLRSRYCAG
jgi:hypothetical protein